MGRYLNVGNAGFLSGRNGEYVDKSGLIAFVNSKLFSEQRFFCVSRCRRFGKSMAARMLAAYYDKSCDSRSLFADLEIARDPSFEKHLNKYPVIYLDMTDFASPQPGLDPVREIDRILTGEILAAYPSVPKSAEEEDLMALLMRVVAQTGDRFFFIIDEWDTLCRELPQESPVMQGYVGWLRRMFKSAQALSVFAGVYMTGILPIKKYNTQSALNNFIEYSMIDPRRMARYFGFTRDEAQALAAKYRMDFNELEKWYDGYHIGTESSIFNPNSVILALDCGQCRSFWGKSASYEAIVPYITLNFEGLKDDILRMLAGQPVKVNTTKFGNDLSAIGSKDDALTALIHLGYLTYDEETQTSRIPNTEVMLELLNAVEKTDWDADTAIEQIKRKQYPAKVAQYTGNLLLVGINYDKESKTHSCKIEKG